MNSYELRIKELESMLEAKDSIIDTCNDLIKSASAMCKQAEDRLLKRIAELELENERLKTNAKRMRGKNE